MANLWLLLKSQFCESYSVSRIGTYFYSLYKGVPPPPSPLALGQRPRFASCFVGQSEEKTGEL